MAVLVDWGWTIRLYFNRGCPHNFLDRLTNISEVKIWPRPLHQLDINTLWKIFHCNRYDPCFPCLYDPGSHLNNFTFGIQQGPNYKVYIILKLIFYSIYISLAALNLLTFLFIVLVSAVLLISIYHVFHGESLQ